MNQEKSSRERSISCAFSRGSRLHPPEGSASSYTDFDGSNRRIRIIRIAKYTKYVNLNQMKKIASRLTRLHSVDTHVKLQADVRRRPLSLRIHNTRVNYEY
jgi:hypothetical protein